VAASGLSGAQVESGPRITVRVFDYAEVQQKTLSSGVAEARRIFQEAGIETDWVACPMGTVVEKSAPVCGGRQGSADINMKILPPSMATGFGLRWQALGFAASSPIPGAGSDAWVFYDRVGELARFRIADRGLILGTAMAHEIGHLLLGLRPHAPSGIMGGKWQRKELGLVAQGHLLFTAEESRQMRNAVRTRPRQAAVTERHSVALSQSSLVGKGE
ncbi:MAG TPA: hypothetical protein VNI35_07795, partial [Nitrospira sp.]|nr:hypothetical protein [Nitrospira sp.]